MNILHETDILLVILIGRSHLVWLSMLIQVICNMISS